jgi:hypothetical protein
MRRLSVRLRNEQDALETFAQIFVQPPAAVATAAGGTS